MPLPLPATGLVLTALMHVGGPMLATSLSTLQHPDTADVPAATAVTGRLTISIADKARIVQAGEPVTYQIVVRNTSPHTTPVTVRLRAPDATHAQLTAAEGTVVADSVAWRSTLSAHETRTYELQAVIRESSASPTVAVIACAHPAADAAELACATDLNTVATQDRPAGTAAWLAAAAFGILATVGSIWLYKKINPEQLTPAKADLAAWDKPGGAPPV